MKTTIYWHVVDDEDSFTEQEVYNESDFERCLVELSQDDKFVVDDVVGKAKYIEKYRNKIMNW